MTPFAFTPTNGVVNIGTSTDLQLGVPGCPTGTEFRLGYWTVMDNGGTACLGASNTSGRIAAVDCQSIPGIFPFPRIEGFSSSIEAPCVLVGNTCSANVPNQGLVVGFGELIQPPYEFTTPQGGFGPLFLNGLQYSPQPGGETAASQPPSPSQPKKIEQIERISAASQVTIREAARDAVLGEGVGDLGARFAELLRAYPNVVSAEVSETSGKVLVDWGELGGREIISIDSIELFAKSHNDPPPDISTSQPDLSSYYETLVEEFWHLLEHDQSVYFGEMSFVFGGAPSATQALRRALTSGGLRIDELPSKVTKGTILEDPNVVRDMLLCRQSKGGAR